MKETYQDHNYKTIVKSILKIIFNLILFIPALIVVIVRDNKRKQNETYSTIENDDKLPNEEKPKFMLATIGQRFIAHVIDLIILVLPLALLMLIIPYVLPALAAMAYNVVWSCNNL